MKLFAHPFDRLGVYGKGGGGSTTSTTTVQQTPAQIALAEIQLSQQKKNEEILGMAQQALSTPREFFSGETVAGFTPAQLQAQEFATTQATQLGETLPSTLDQILQFGTQDVLDPNSELTRAAIEAAIRPTTQNFLENVFPQLGSAAQAAGAFGGARQGIVESQTARDLNQTVGDISAKISFDAFQRGLDTFDRTAALAPQLASARFIPSDVLSQVGAQQQFQNQQQILAQREKFDFAQNEEFARISDLTDIQSRLSGGTGAITQGGGSTTTGPGAPKGNVAQGALSGAATGASIGSVVPGVGTAWGAAIGGLLGAVGAF